MSATSENRAKFTPLPSYVAPRGYAVPGQISMAAFRRAGGARPHVVQCVVQCAAVTQVGDRLTPRSPPVCALLTRSGVLVYRRHTGATNLPNDSEVSRQ